MYFDIYQKFPFNQIMDNIIQVMDNKNTHFVIVCFIMQLLIDWIVYRLCVEQNDI